MNHLSFLSKFNAFTRDIILQTYPKQFLTFSHIEITKGPINIYQPKFIVRNQGKFPWKKCFCWIVHCIAWKRCELSTLPSKCCWGKKNQLKWKLKMLVYFNATQRTHKSLTSGGYLEIQRWQVLWRCMLDWLHLS